MKIRNVSGVPREIDATGQTVDKNDEIEVDDLLGAALCEQPANWQPVGAQGPPADEKPKQRGRAADTTPEGENEESV